MEDAITTQAFIILDKLAFNIAYFALFGGIMGFLSTVIIIRRRNRNLAFDRPFYIWTLFSKLIMYYLPVVFGLFFTCIGAIYGANETVSGLIALGVDNIMEVLVNQYHAVLNYIIAYAIDDKVSGYLFTGIYSSTFSLFCVVFLKIPIIEFIAIRIYRFIFNWSPKVVANSQGHVSLG